MNYSKFIEQVKNDPKKCPTTAYSLLVNGKVIKAGKSVQNACKRHLNDLQKSEGDYPYKFDINRANHVFNFFEKFCKHSKGEWAGQPIKLELWQKFLLGSLFGWVRKSDNTRRFTLSYTQIARKQGKSLMSSGLSLYMFMIDNEQGAECYTASIKRDTAKIVWNDAMRMVKASPLLRKNVRIQESLNTMSYGNSVLKALSADSGQDGLNIHYFSLDEYHLLKNNEMYDVLVSGMGARRNPLGFIITTAGDSKGGTSPCYRLYEYGKQVLDGTLQNENMFFYIAEMDGPEQIHDPNNWIMSNPNLDVTVNQDSLMQAYTRAVDGGEMDNFMIKHMNMWIQRKDSYFPLDKWANFPTSENLKGKDCYIGIDLSSKIDLTSVSAVFPLDNGKYAVLNHNFMPSESLNEKERIDKVPYKKWVQDGYITLTTGDVVDVDFIFEYIKELSEQYSIIDIGCDPWNATALMTMLSNEGFTVHEVRQGYRTLSEPIKFTKELMIQEKFIHGNNPVLKWATANAVAQFDANENVILNKAKSINRIDPIASTVTGMVSAMLHDYEDSLEKHITKDYQIW